MAWKKIILSGSDATLNTLSVDGNITGTFVGALSSSAQIATEISGALSNAAIADLGAGIISSSGQIADDISGSLSNSAIAGLGAGIISSSAQIDSDLFDIDGLVSSSTQVVSLLDNQDVDFGTGQVTASFFKGDGSGLTNIDIAQTATVVSDFTNITTHTVSHNFGTKNVMATVYDDNDYQIIPASVQAVNDNQVTITFDSSTSGTIIVGKGGHVVSGSIPFDNILNTPTLISQSAQVNADSIANFDTNVKDKLNADNVISSSAQLASDISGSLSNAAIADLGAGIISSSAQIDSDLFDIDGLVSSSAISSTAQGQVTLTTNGVAATAVDLGLQTSDSPTFTNLTLTGDLTVQGDTTSVNTSNLLVEDKFILVGSGSTAPEGGIIVDGGTNNGKLYGYDNDDSRWGYQSGVGDGANTMTPTAYAVQVVDIDAGNTDIPEYQKNGNIKTDSGVVWIYA